MKKILTKNIILLYCILFIAFSCKNKIKLSKNSESFNKFINEFIPVELPIVLDENVLNNKKIPQHVNISYKFLYDYTNYDVTGRKLEIYNSDIYYIGKLNTNNNNFSYFSMIYCIYFDNIEQIIIANFSKENEKRISQLVLYGNDFKNYLLTSIIDTNFIISTKMLYSYKHKQLPPFKNNPDYFFVKIEEEKYKINSNGEFEQIYSDNEGKHYVALKNGNDYIYPVESPESVYNLSFNLKYFESRVPDSKCKLPKGYRMAKDTTPFKFKTLEN